MTKRKAPKVGGDYAVGYAKPPKHGQFKKGQARPPRKPKQPETLDLAAFIQEELATPVSFKDENGRDCRLSKLRVLAKLLVNEALKTGNPKHLRDYLPKSTAAVNDDYSEADLAIIARFLRLHSESGGGDGSDT